MKTIFKIMVWMMLMNIMVGIMIQAFPSLSDTTDPSYNSLNKLEYKQNYEGVFVTGMNGTLNPTSLAETKADAVTELLNVIGLGSIIKLKDQLLNYAYGVPIMLDKLVGGSMNEGLHAILFNEAYGLLFVIMHICYLLSFFYLVTGKSLTSDDG